MQSTTRSDETPIDWQAIEASPQFQELVKTRRAFVLPATIFFLCWYLGFILLAGYAPEFMGERIYEGVTVGYMLALTQFAMVWILGIKYLRKADQEFDPLERKALEFADSLQAKSTATAAETATAQPATKEPLVVSSLHAEPIGSDGVHIPYSYGEDSETARIVVDGEHVFVYADEHGVPARFDRTEFMSALGAGSPAGNGKFTPTAGAR